MTPKFDNKDYVSIIKNKDATYIIRWDKISNFFTLEDTKGDKVVIYKSAIDNITSEIEKLNDLISEPKNKPSL